MGHHWMIVLMHLLEALGDAWEDLADEMDALEEQRSCPLGKATKSTIMMIKRHHE
jgi:hypothetical protein